MSDKNKKEEIFFRFYYFIQGQEKYHS